LMLATGFAAVAVACLQNTQLTSAWAGDNFWTSQLIIAPGLSFIFVALIGSLLTAIPLSPAGLGFAQAGVIGVLTVVYNIPLAEATAITILDWVISVLSIIVIGAVVYVVSPMPRGMGRIPQPPATTSVPTTA